MKKYIITSAQTGNSKIVYGSGFHISDHSIIISKDNKMVAIIPIIGFMIEEE